MKFFIAATTKKHIWTLRVHKKNSRIQITRGIGISKNMKFVKATITIMQVEKFPLYKLLMLFWIYFYNFIKYKNKNFSFSQKNFLSLDPNAGLKNWKQRTYYWVSPHSYKPSLEQNFKRNSCKINGIIHFLGTESGIEVLVKFTVSVFGWKYNTKWSFLATISSTHVYHW